MGSRGAHHRHPQVRGFDRVRKQGPDGRHAPVAGAGLELPWRHRGVRGEHPDHAATAEITQWVSNHTDMTDPAGRRAMIANLGNQDLRRADTQDPHLTTLQCE